MQSGPSPILNLPGELLIKIFVPLLQHTTAAWDRDDLIEGPEPTSYAQGLPGPRSADCLQPQLLCVCRRFNETGTRLLYANELVIVANTEWGCTDAQSIEFTRAHLGKLSYSPRDDAHRLKKIQVIIYTSDHRLGSPRDSDGKFLDEMFASLALHQPRWDEVAFSIVGLTAPDTYGMNRAQGQRLLYGLGRLHARHRADGAGVIKETRDDLIWAMEQPRHTYPLWVLYEDLKAYLDIYDPFPTTSDRGPQRFNRSNQRIPRREFLKQQSREAAESHDEETFYQVMDTAVRHVTTVLDGQVEQDCHLAGGRETIHRMAREKSDQLLSAKERKWQGGYIINSLPAPARPLLTTQPGVHLIVI